jgi:hypothetical protein
VRAVRPSVAGTTATAGEAFAGKLAGGTYLLRPASPIRAVGLAVGSSARPLTWARTIAGASWLHVPDALSGLSRTGETAIGTWTPGATPRITTGLWAT